MGDQFLNSDDDLERGDLELMRKYEDEPPRKRTHFVRFLTRDQVNASIDLLNTVCDEPFPHIPADAEKFNIKAPDGDEVFTGVRAGAQGARFVCRLHREVFDERVQL